MIKDILKKVIPGPIIKGLMFFNNLRSILGNYLYDLTKYSRYSGTLKVSSDQQLEARIIAHYHVLEKGLSMPSPRVPFGTDMASSLILLLRKYEEKGYVKTRSQIQVGQRVLEAYLEFHKNNGFKLVEIREEFKKLNLNREQKIDAGSKVVQKSEIIENADGKFDTVTISRHSVRNYKNCSVNITKIENAIKLAQKSPSTCNRQSSKVYVIRDGSLIRSTLELQNGNRGFGHLCKLLLVVTSDLQSFCGANERNQAFIDSGMFAMSLLYALHFYKLGACPLNWSVEKRCDRLLRSLLKISESEVVSMMISVGELPDKFSVACSQRKDLDEVMHLIVN